MGHDYNIGKPLEKGMWLLNRQAFRILVRSFNIGKRLK